MKKFEYLKIPSVSFTRMDRLSIDEKKLNLLGENGWELITFTFWNDRVAFGYFKRELPVKTKAK